MTWAIDNGKWGLPFTPKLTQLLHFPLPREKPEPILFSLEVSGGQNRKQGTKEVDMHRKEPGLSLPASCLSFPICKMGSMLPHAFPCPRTEPTVAEGVRVGGLKLYVRQWGDSTSQKKKRKKRTSTKQKQKKRKREAGGRGGAKESENK